MRVIAGTARSLPLKTVPGMNTRPTQDRIKETLFNMLTSYVPGAVFVDLFAGSGGIGIEALSRGARKAYFVDREKAACRVIRENLAFTHLDDRAELIETDVMNGLSVIAKKQNGPADIIFADPPYHEGFEEPLFDHLSRSELVSDSTLIIVEADLKTEFNFLEEKGFRILKEKKYKTNKHVWIMKETI